MKKLEPHALCLVLPEMTPAEFQQLTDSIRTEGQHDAIVTYEGKILEGRHRYQACLNLGIEPVIEEYDEQIHGKSPTQYVMAKNVFRRHLSVSQRAAIAIEIIPFFEAEANARKARATTPAPAAEQSAAEAPPAENEPRPEAQAAAVVGVSESSVRRAKRVKDQDPAAFEDVRAGKKSVHAAAQAAPKPATAVPAEFQRKTAYDQLVKDHGEEFAKAALSGDVLPKAVDFEDFMTLDAETQTSILPLIIERWGTKKAVAFLGAAPTIDDPIKKLVLKHNAGKKKKSSFVIGAFTITVQKVEPAEAPPPESAPAPETTAAP